MKWLRSPKAYPVYLVCSAAFVMFTIIHSGEPSSRTFPFMLFVATLLCILYACGEVAITLIGWQKEKEEIYQSVSRAITAIGVGICFMLLIAAYEASKATFAT